MKRQIEFEQVESEAKKMISYCMSFADAVDCLSTETDIDINKGGYGYLAYINAAYNILINTDWSNLKPRYDEFYGVEQGSPAYELFDGLVWVSRDNVKKQALDYMKEILSDDAYNDFELYLDNI